MCKYILFGNDTPKNSCRLSKPLLLKQEHQDNGFQPIMEEILSEIVNFRIFTNQDDVVPVDIIESLRSIVSEFKFMTEYRHDLSDTKAL